MPGKRMKPKRNPFVYDTNHYGPMTVGQLVELVKSFPSEFGKGLDTRICIADVEGNNGTVTDVMVPWHRPGDVVLAIDPHSGNMDYETEEVKQ